MDQSAHQTIAAVDEMEKGLLPPEPSGFSLPPPEKGVARPLDEEITLFGQTTAIIIVLHAQMSGFENSIAL